MLLVRIELHSAITGEVTEIGRATITNRGDGPGNKRGNYDVAVHANGRGVAREGKVENYPRLAYNVWRLVIRGLLDCFPEERR